MSDLITRLRAQRDAANVRYDAALEKVADAHASEMTLRLEDLGKIASVCNQISQLLHYEELRASGALAQNTKPGQVALS